MKKGHRVPTIDDYLAAPAHPLRQIGGGRRFAVERQKPNRDFPLVSVITIVRNRKETASQTIASVLNQTYPNIEYVIVDGASVDGTLEVIKQFDDKIDLWISEPDSPVDAVNKAISFTRGDYIFWLGSDDWIDGKFIEIALDVLLKTEADFVYGDIIWYEADMRRVLVKGNVDYAKEMPYLRYFNFNAMVMKKTCFLRAGLMDLNMAAANDLDWFLRLHTIYRPQGIYESGLVVHTRAGGMSDKNFVLNLSNNLYALLNHGSPKLRTFIFIAALFIRKGLKYLLQICLPKRLYLWVARFVRAFRKRYSRSYSRTFIELP